jgi:hypothetical protein
MILLKMLCFIDFTEFFHGETAQFWFPEDESWEFSWEFSRIEEVIRFVVIGLISEKSYLIFWSFQLGFNWKLKIWCLLMGKRSSRTIWDDIRCVLCCRFPATFSPSNFRLISQPAQSWRISSWQLPWYPSNKATRFDFLLSHFWAAKRELISKQKDKYLRHTKRAPY